MSLRLGISSSPHNLLILLTQVHDWCSDKDMKYLLPAPDITRIQQSTDRLRTGNIIINNIH